MYEYGRWLCTAEAGPYWCHEDGWSAQVAKPENTFMSTYQSVKPLVACFHFETVAQVEVAAAAL